MLYKRRYFGIHYELNYTEIHNAVSKRLTERGSDYICVADGVEMCFANRHTDYMSVVNGGMFSICDSSYVPLYIRWIYGENCRQYSGSEIFYDIVCSRKYRMIFLGTRQVILDGLKKSLIKINPDVENMQFVELPFKSVEDFDYPAIAKFIEQDGAEIIWIALGAVKQEQFMARLKPYLRHGIMIAVGAVFKFFSGVDVKRAPQWMIRHHLEFVHRLWYEPVKQLKRCFYIVRTLPMILYKEYRISRKDAENASDV